MKSNRNLQELGQKGSYARAYSPNNPPPYPVTSVDGKTGAVSTGIQVSGKYEYLCVIDASFQESSETDPVFTGKIWWETLTDKPILSQPDTRPFWMAVHSGTYKVGGFLANTGDSMHFFIPFYMSLSLDDILVFGMSNKNTPRNLSAIRMESIFPSYVLLPPSV